jgi:hypothetical protein
MVTRKGLPTGRRQRRMGRHNGSDQAMQQVSLGLDRTMADYLSGYRTMASPCRKGNDYNLLRINVRNSIVLSELNPLRLQLHKAVTQENQLLSSRPKPSAK